jgi:hypothetical protein
MGQQINIALASPVVTLDAGGNPDSVFIFVAGSTLTTCANSEIVLRNGAKAENVYWVLGTALTMGADSVLVGNVLAGSAITIGTNGKICGRAIAKTAVTCETHCTVEIPDNSHLSCSQYVETTLCGSAEAEWYLAAINNYNNGGVVTSIQEIQDNAEIDRDGVADLSVEVRFPDCGIIGSVVFSLDDFEDEGIQTENEIPYYLKGNLYANVRPVVALLDDGEHTIWAKAFTGKDGEGNLVKNVNISFTLSQS